MNNAVLSGKAGCYKDQSEGREEVMSVFEEMKEEGREEGREEIRKEMLEERRREKQREQEAAYEDLVFKVQDAYAMDIPLEKIAKLFTLTVERTKQILAEGRQPA